MKSGRSREVGEVGENRSVDIASAPAGVSGMDEMMEAKLWRNPCWFSFRLNYMALRYNLPLYEWVRRKYGLSRPEYVVIYSLGLCKGGQARDIVRSSGFPKNTLSRAIANLEKQGLIERKHFPGNGRSQALFLTKSGLDLFDQTLPAFIAHEQVMLSGLTEDECAILSRIMAKMVLNASHWPMELADDAF